MASFKLAAEIEGHDGPVTTLATTSERPDLLVSGSRDRTVMVWKLVRTSEEYAHAQRRLYGHSHFVEDVKLSNDGHYALSCSWDNTLRLWDLTNGVCARRFVGHTKDVLGVAFSADNRQIMSCGRDRLVKLWNTLGECKFTFENQGHTEWVSDVAFSPNAATPVAVSCGWDRVVKVWSLGEEFKMLYTLTGATGYLSTVCVSPEGSLCAAAGKEGTIFIYDLKEGKFLYSLEAGSEVYQLVFNPNKFWLCAATQKDIKVFDLQNHSCIAELPNPTPEKKGKKDPKTPACISVAWGADSNTIFAGYTDKVIRVYENADK